MNAQSILKKLKSLGADRYCSTLKRHGVVGPVYGVKIEDLKKIQKQVGNDHDLALDLYDSGVYDAMYLAGLLADSQKITKTLLRKWLKQATSPTLQEYTIPGLAAESKHGHDLAIEWMASTKEEVAVAGWATFSGLVSITEDDALDLKEIKQLLKQVEKKIHTSPNRVRYWMNNFVISVACYVAPLMETAIQSAEKIGKVTVDMGETACKIPDAVPYIAKVQKRGTIGKKRKSARC
ncbi:DNA alkylation repair protein [Planctomycetaceae bacterium]|jgi:3-methyladenine DNA glycosylase AlkD|nr:DNA alkylation repair protein [bacterium]MDB4679821.1 DNA alkylation repair protein [Planctomycetaceae bacterium]MDC0262163.1 DNA alkylation repair protein [Planctomycetaceae bacterium]MDC0307643.1 DNA alkylation repair protein [Planctomycetaceae bacterium]MDG2391029.1 DNA alkylation repair protein [Planctomycetaceae bacterium]